MQLCPRILLEFTSFRNLFGIIWDHLAQLSFNVARDSRTVEDIWSLPKMTPKKNSRLLLEFGTTKRERPLEMFEKFDSKLGFNPILQ